jgi:hypothetical protein
MEPNREPNFRLVATTSAFLNSEERTVAVTASFTQEEVLAQFLKRAGFSEYR